MDGGVPQGSILGPLIILLYVNDFSQYVNADHLVLADSQHGLNIKYNNVCKKF